MTPKDLAEREGKPIALAWIDAAIAALRGYLEELVAGEPSPSRELARSALAINFSLQPDRSVVETAFYVWRILGTFVRARGVIAASASSFSSVSLEEARAVFPPETLVPPAYAIHRHGVFFTPHFASFGPRCRAAMIVHESVHVIDATSGLPHIHISEWQEPAFSAQTVEESIHNPSSYASFSAQIHEGVAAWPPSARYGAGRPRD